MMTTLTCPGHRFLGSAATGPWNTAAACALAAYAGLVGLHAVQYCTVLYGKVAFIVAKSLLAASSLLGVEVGAELAGR
jgi:hypothetical protein